MDNTQTKEVTEENVEKALETFKPNAAFASAMSLMPKDYKQVMELASIACKSGMVPKDFANNPNGAAMAIMFGLELGLSPTQALQNVMVVNGRPSLWGDAVLALALGSEQIEEFAEDAPDLALHQGFGRCVVKRRGMSNPVTRVFSLEDAKRAGLMTKSTWQQYPGRMLMMRARSWALRDTVPDVLKGIQVREEIYDIGEIETVPMPKRAGVAQEAQIVTGGEVPAATSSEPDAQAPGDSPTDLVDENDRKELFKMRVDAKVPVADTKAYLHSQFGVPDTSKLTKAQAEAFKVWLVKHSR